MMHSASICEDVSGETYFRRIGLYYEHPTHNRPPFNRQDMNALYLNTILRRLLQTAALLSLLLVIPNGARAQATQQLALITEVSGAVSVARAGESTFDPVTWGTQLFEGDRIKTDSDASASILFSNNNLLTLGSNSSMTIAGGSTPSSATPMREVDSDLLASASDLTLHRAGEGEIAALGGLRSGSSGNVLEPLSPRNTNIVATSPVFIWQSNGEFDAYRVKILSDEGLVWSGEATGFDLAYPADAPSLKPGTDYYWQVEGEDLLDTEKSSMVSFRILDPEIQTVIENGEARIGKLFGDDPESTNYYYVLGSFYAKHGMLESAVKSFSEIATRYPDAVLPNEILGRLYSDMGLTGDAISALQRAIDLGEK
jgi:hypothetical protein